MELINTKPKEEMKYSQVGITKVDNGYLVVCAKEDPQAYPPQETFVYADFSQVLAFLSPTKLKLVQ